MTRGRNLRAVRAVRERLVEVHLWLPYAYPYCLSADIRADLHRLLDRPSIGAIPWQPSPAAGQMLVHCRVRVSRQARNVLRLLADLHKTTISEAARGVIAAEGAEE